MSAARGLRILQLTSHLEVGGISHYALSLSAQLIRRGHRVVIASDQGQLTARAAAIGADYWPLPLHTSAEFSPRVFRAGRELAQRLRASPVDVLHAHTRVGQVVAERLSRRLGVPYVTTWHGVFRRNLGRRLWPCTGLRTIAISEPVRRHLLETFRVPADRVRLIWNGVDTDRFAQAPAPEAVARFRAQHHLPAGTPVIGGIGRLASGRVKGFDLLLAAAARARREVPGLHVLIAGDGPRRPFLEAKAAQFGLAEVTHFTGLVEDVRLPLAVMDVFIFPARWPEGFGLVLTEAMAAGKPVVATRVGAVPDIVEHGRSGLLVEAEDAAGLGRAVVEVLRGGPVAGRLGAEAQRRVREAFSLTAMTDGIEAVYREVLTATEGVGRRA